MTQFKVNLVNSNAVWEARRRYKVSNTVSHNGSIYQNVTGHNSEPGTSGDWVATIPDTGSFQLVANRKDDWNKDLTGLKYPQHELVRNSLTTFALAFGTSGFVSHTDSVELQDISDTVLRVTANDYPLLFADELYSGNIDNAIKLFPQQDFPLANIPGITADGTYIRYVAYLSDGSLNFSNQPYSQDNNYAQIGRITIKRVAGVVTFIDAVGSSRNAVTTPDLAGNSNLTRLYAPLSSDVEVKPNANRTMNHAGGFITGQSINWGAGNVNYKTILAQNPVQFSRITPAINTSTTPLPIVTVLDVATYWNGTALVAVPTNANATVQRVLISDAGSIVVQAGEEVFDNFDEAKAGYSVARFTQILPKASYVEIGRIVAVKTTTNLQNEADAQFYASGGAGSGGGGSSSAGTDIGVVLSATQALVTSSTGSDGAIPLADATHAGLLGPGTQSIYGIKSFEAGQILIKDSGASVYGKLSLEDSQFIVRHDATNIIINFQQNDFVFFKNQGITLVLSTENLSATHTLSAPNKSGTIALTSDLHNALTLGTANGLSLATQALSLGLAGPSATGALSSTDWNTFNNKQHSLGFTAENVANKSTTLDTDKTSDTKYPSVKSVFDWATGLFAKDADVVHKTGDETILDTKTFSSAIKTTGVQDLLGNSPYALQNGTILYHTAKWFTPTNTVSSSGATVTSVGTQFTSDMVGAKLIINGEQRIIITYTSTTVVVVDSAYSTNYSGIVAGNWGVYSIEREYKNGYINNYTFNGFIYEKSIEDSFFGIINSVKELKTNSGTNGNVKVLSVKDSNDNVMSYLRADGGIYGKFVGTSDNATAAINESGNNTNGIGLSPSSRIQWGNTSAWYDIKDLGLRRNASGRLEIYDGITATGLDADRRDLMVRKLLVNTSTDNGVDAIQVNGTISASPATLSNQVTILSQLTSNFLDEGNGIGTVFSNQPRANYGNIGLDAFDFSYSDTASTVFGATGEQSFAVGIDVVASGFNSTVFGYKADSGGNGDFVTGFNLKSRGYTNFVTGIGHDVTGTNVMVVGQASDIINDSIVTFNDPNAVVFAVGNGTIQDANQGYSVLTRSTALLVRKNGLAEMKQLLINQVSDTGYGIQLTVGGLTTTTTPDGIVVINNGTTGGGGGGVFSYHTSLNNAKGFGYHVGMNGSSSKGFYVNSGISSNKLGDAFTIYDATTTSNIFVISETGKMLINVPANATSQINAISVVNNGATGSANTYSFHTDLYNTRNTGLLVQMRGSGQTAITVQTATGGSGNGSAFQILNLATTKFVILEDGRLYMPDCPTYADNAAAVAGGQFGGIVYKTATGELRIVV